jgi:hypothetical protein
VVVKDIDVWVVGLTSPVTMPPMSMSYLTITSAVKTAMNRLKNITMSFGLTTIQGGTKMSLRKLKEKREMVRNLQEDIEELEGDLMGAETEYKGHYACIQSISVMYDWACLYVEEENGNQYDVELTIDELEELLK